MTLQISRTDLLGKKGVTLTHHIWRLSKTSIYNKEANLMKFFTYSYLVCLLHSLHKHVVIFKTS